jgi:hypothetical protein
MKSFWFPGILSVVVTMITKCAIVECYVSTRCKPTTTFYGPIAINSNLPSSSILRKNNAQYSLRYGRCLAATLKNSDDEKSKKLGGTTSTRNLFALTEIFGKISSAISPNDDKTGMEKTVQNESLQKTTLMTAEEIVGIALKIKKEYEAIFWAVRAVFPPILSHKILYYT